MLIHHNIITLTPSPSIFPPSLPPPSRQEFFNDLYHRFLLSPKPSMKAMCLQAMAIVYGNCYDEIGPFNDTEYIMKKMSHVSGWWVWLGRGYHLCVSCSVRIRRRGIVC